ncbi:hypothetical protein LPJ76_001959 [Coemansia sp. RSA 638]|nr:hypothetical protein LPJ76_001959 [Coemansia sp. RSA 638]
MVESFDIVKQPEDVPFYAGLLLTSYSFCQAIPSMYWGALSDRIGRRPVLLIGLAGDLATFVLFGLSKSYTWAIVTRSLNGVFASNSAVVKSVVAEIADDTNRPRMMALLPLMWNVGVVAGAAVGGLLADPANQYPSIFGRFEILHTFPYLLPCLAGSVTTAIGLVTGLLKLQETLVIEPATFIPEAQEDGTATESTPLVAQRNAEQPKRPSFLSLMTPTRKLVLGTNVLLWLVISMEHNLYSMFAATPSSSGGLGFSPRNIGASLAFTSIAVLILQLKGYQAINAKFGTLKCCQIGLQIMTPVFFAIPFLSLLSSHIEHAYGGVTLSSLPAPENWLSFAALEYCALWLLLLVFLLTRTVGDALSGTSLNLLVANIAPSATTLGVFNGVQQLCTTFMRIIGPVLSGTLWGWSIKHSLVYPFNSHLAWVVCGLVTATAWRLSLKLPDSVNIYLPGQNQRNRR